MAERDETQESLNPKSHERRVETTKVNLIFTLKPISRNFVIVNSSKRKWPKE